MALDAIIFLKKLRSGVSNFKDSYLNDDETKNI